MAKYICKVQHPSKSFRLVVPHDLVIAKRWGDANWVLVEAEGDDKIIIRRFVDGAMLKDDHRARFITED